MHYIKISLLILVFGVTACQQDAAPPAQKIEHKLVQGPFPAEIEGQIAYVHRIDPTAEMLIFLEGYDNEFFMKESQYHQLGFAEGLKVQINVTLRKDPQCEKDCYQVNSGRVAVK